MRICNRKLAKRIILNERLIDVLSTRLTTADWLKEQVMLRATIDCDEKTLANNGYDRKGHKVVQS